MIRDYREEDVDQVLAIWLSASILAHDFVPAAFWESQVEAMRDAYLPAAETRVFEEAGQISGFYCLVETTLAAIFVSPERQGRGIGSALIEDAKRCRESLTLTVYQANRSSVEFYRKHGFVIHDEQLDANTGQPEWVMEYRGVDGAALAM
ncbi:acetyltransferase [Bisbaumannia pacifica]|uniref:Acetyltransferase n=1 Tax=Bisbaumannia pacifica TaxID=77098 RepID=A0A510XDV5_9GAMM|nr:N-acetyltransferase [Halomonas pacifica]GEK48897.1 acetyltransferase [Halomonas pacifica]